MEVDAEMVSLMPPVVREAIATLGKFSRKEILQCAYGAEDESQLIHQLIYRRLGQIQNALFDFKHKLKLAELEKEVNGVSAVLRQTKLGRMCEEARARGEDIRPIREELMEATMLAVAHEVSRGQNKELVLTPTRQPVAPSSSPDSPPSSPPPTQVDEHAMPVKRKPGRPRKVVTEAPPADKVESKVDVPTAPVTTTESKTVTVDSSPVVVPAQTTSTESVPNVVPAKPPKLAKKKELVDELNWNKVIDPSLVCCEHMRRDVIETTETYCDRSVVQVRLWTGLFGRKPVKKLFKSEDGTRTYWVRKFTLHNGVLNYIELEQPPSAYWIVWDSMSDLKVRFTKDKCLELALERAKKLGLNGGKLEQSLSDAFNVMRCHHTHPGKRDRGICCMVDKERVEVNGEKDWLYTLRPRMLEETAEKFMELVDKSRTGEEVVNAQVVREFTKS